MLPSPLRRLTRYGRLARLDRFRPRFFGCRALIRLRGGGGASLRFSTAGGDASGNAPLTTFVCPRSRSRHHPRSFYTRLTTCTPSSSSLPPSYLPAPLPPPRPTPPHPFSPPTLPPPPSSFPPPYPPASSTRPHRILTNSLHSRVLPPWPTPLQRPTRRRTQSIVMRRSYPEPGVACTNVIGVRGWAG